MIVCYNKDCKRLASESSITRSRRSFWDNQFSSDKKKLPEKKKPSLLVIHAEEKVSSQILVLVTGKISLDGLRL